MISIDALRGYVLEEVVAQMLGSCGYRILKNAADDPEALADGRHGLLVRGRGADHQADALGELALPTPFSLPIRLFAEAKFRRTRTGLADVRNALGVINDVNERHRHSTSDRLLPAKRYLYRYSLFSANGFTEAAQSFALAQQISLIDLRGPAFADIRAAVRDATDALHRLAREHGQTSTFPTGQMRTALRLALGTWQRDEPAKHLQARANSTQSQRAAMAAAEVKIGNETNLLPREELASIAAKLDDDLTDIFVLAFPDAPFIIALRPDDIAIFDAFLDGGDGIRNIHIGFDPNAGQGVGEWVITAEEAPELPLAYFGLPPMLDAWLLAEGGEARERAIRIKHDQLSTMTVYRGQRTTQLRFVPLVRRSQRLQTYADDRDSPLRRDNPTPAIRRLHQPTNGTPPTDPPPDLHTLYPRSVDSYGWTADALRALLELLDEQRPIQADVLRAAAGNGGVLPRSEVYRIGQYPMDRTLRGFTRPIHRLHDQLVEGGVIPEEAIYPLAPWYPRPGPAVWFVMPPRVAELMRTLDLEPPS